MLVHIVSGFGPTQHSSNENPAGWPAGCLIKAHCQRFLSRASKSLCFNEAFINGQVRANNFTGNIKRTIKGNVNQRCRETTSNSLEALTWTYCSSNQISKKDVYASATVYEHIQDAHTHKYSASIMSQTLPCEHRNAYARENIDMHIKGI